ncbi:peptidoglycan-binding domain-containing protein [Nodosilinea sp. PGN35]|uniref:peptidoglycan-binding domain-containing protein n=1 Tax=Nodosilinea sp. PGN35 TaxID=3020489 RepID=UPI0023B2BF1C|nr:peptidoglycan-binding domain-containing protein [Nodosilinea sp. TSF1-S3]MDF0366489.1 peptidoglycan-binding domain-containing protein [Nodosilinea sp. TSF1-S3]
MGEPLTQQIPGIVDADCLSLVREYCRLAAQPSLSDGEGQRLEELLALAEADGRLDFWINEADHFIDHAIGLGSATRVYASVNENLKARLRELLDLTHSTHPGDKALELLEELDESLAEGARQVQQQLAKHGYDPGPVDGVAGPKTQRALRDFQQSQDGR